MIDLSAQEFAFLLFSAADFRELKERERPFFAKLMKYREEEDGES